MLVAVIPPTRSSEPTSGGPVAANLGSNSLSAHIPEAVSLAGRSRPTPKAIPCGPSKSEELSRKDFVKSHVMKPVIAVYGAVALFTAHACALTGHDEIAYQGTSPEGTYAASVTAHWGPSEQYSWWSLDVTRQGKPFLSDVYLSPFYGWTCVSNGRAFWEVEHLIHFHSPGAGQGRVVSLDVSNATDGPIPLAEIQMRSVDEKGFSHCPTYLLLVDLPPGKSVRPSPCPMIHAGSRYVRLHCEFNNKTNTAIFAIPTGCKPSAPYLPLKLEHQITVMLTADGPTINGGAFQRLTEQEANALVKGKVFLPLVEEKRDHRKENQ